MKLTQDTESDNITGNGDGNGEDTARMKPGNLGPHTSAAINLLRERGKPGTTISVEEMTAAVRRDCSSKGSGYGNVTSAIRHLESTDGIVWRWSRAAKCWQCLSDSGKIGVIGSYNTHCVKVSRRAGRVGATVNKAALKPEDKRDYDLAMTVTGMLAMVGSASFKKRAALALERADGRLREPDAEKLLGLMKE